jgi:cellulose synthase/poly-beta-1,6-N-acetylglucosamine synthase-like glycosyltransferase
MIAGGLFMLALALHPFLTYPLSLGLVRALSGRRTTGPGAAGRQPSSLALCFCAHDEEEVIAGKAANAIAAAERAGVAVEILAYLDACSDRTAEILAGFAPRIRVIEEAGHFGKTHGMNRLVAETDAEVVAFTDANVMLAPDALQRLLRWFADPAVGCVCGHLSYVNEGESVTASTGSLYWRLEERVKQLESDTGSAMGADGSIFAVRRALHRPVPPDLIDDMHLSLGILCQGWRVVRAADVRAFERSAARPAEEFRRKVRIACQAFNVHRALWPRLRRLPAWTVYKYVSHKVLRWLAIYAAAAGALLLTAGLLASGGWGLAAGLWAAGLAGIGLGLATRLPPFPQAVDVLFSLAGAGLGVWRSLRGDRFQTWTPAASVRTALRH